MTAFHRLTIDEAPAYLVGRGLVARDEAVTVRELTGGVSSVVILAESAARRIILKQALPKLKVQADWPSRPDRSSVEVEAIRAYAPYLPTGAVPVIRDADADRYCFVMDAAPAAARNWKTELLGGRADETLAARAGAILAGMHLGTARDAAARERFDDREFFESLRVDPYLWQVCRVYPELRPVIEPLVETMLATRVTLVHGDYSPKNMLVHAGDLLILDFEVAHWGDPSFDLAFCLNHFLLKAVYLDALADRYLALATAFWRAYAPALALDTSGTLLARTLLLQGGLMLARIDGKSPVEYITSEPMRDRVRRISRRILRERPTDVAQSLAIVRSTH